MANFQARKSEHSSGNFIDKDVDMAEEDNSFEVEKVHFVDHFVRYFL